MQSESNEDLLKDPREIRLANCSSNMIISTETLTLLFYEMFKFYGSWSLGTILCIDLVKDFILTLAGKDFD